MNSPKKRILLTAASSGIGTAVVQHLQHDPQIELILHSRKPSETIKRLLEAAPELKSRFYQCDLSKEEEVANMHASIIKEHGPVHALVNFAGTSIDGQFWKLSASQFTNVINDNLLSNFLISKYFYEDMKANGGGQIVFISSLAGATGLFGASAYSTAKSGLTGLAKTLAKELAKWNISVNVLSLGYFEFGLIERAPEDRLTGLIQEIPFKRLGQSEDIGNWIAFLMSDRASYFTGQTIHLNGGLY